MNRIDQTLTTLREQGKTVLSPYITAGDPNPAMTVPMMHALVEAGANLLELRIPFSDPMAEGPVIQAAMERALKHGVNCDTVLAMVHEFRVKDKHTPLVLMGYLNPIEQYGYRAFAKKAKEVGVDGVIIVDLPPEESDALLLECQSVDLYPIYLCSPTTADVRMMALKHYAKGYLYYVALKGVTGADSFDLEAVKAQYVRRKAQTSLPLMVGFGIKTPLLAAKVASFADGVIVGAALIQEIEQAVLEKKDGIKAAATFIRNMRRAIDVHEG